MEVETTVAARAALEGVLQDPAQRSRLLAYARVRFGIAADDSEDLLQETALDALRQRSLVRSPRGFVFTVFHARCCRWVRVQQARRRLFTAGPEAPGQTRPAAPEEIDLRLTIQRALDELSAACRKLLLAYYVEGQSLREAASAMTLAYSGVWKTINRCLKKLRQCLA